jgi:hypothetical protein
MKAKPADRRRHPRVKVGGTARGTFKAGYDVSVVDIRLGGVLIEHFPIVQSGNFFDLHLTLPGRKVRLKCRVVLSGIHRVAGAGRRRKPLYRTELQFVDLPDEARQAIADYITAVTDREDGTGSTAPGPTAPLNHGRLRPQRPVHTR